MAIAGTIILVHCHVVKSLQLTLRSGTRRFHLRVPDLKVSCRDFAEIGHQNGSPSNGHQGDKPYCRAAFRLLELVSYLFTINLL